MKKLFLKIIVALVVVVIAALVVVTMSLDRIVKAGVEKAGPQITKVEMKLEKVDISLLSGKGELSGLFIGNPAGFKTESAIKAGSVRVAIHPASVFGDKIVVDSVNITAPEITFEGGLTKNNLSTILANIDSTLGGTSSADKTEPGTDSQKKLQVNDLVIADARINVSLTDLGGKAVTLPLPAIHLTNLGTDAEGITAADLSKRILSAVLEGSTKAVGGAIKDIGKGVADAATSAVKSVTEDPAKAVKGVTDLFKKNK